MQAELVVDLRTRGTQDGAHAALIRSTLTGIVHGEAIYLYACDINAGSLIRVEDAGDQ